MPYAINRTFSIDGLPADASKMTDGFCHAVVCDDPDSAHDLTWMAALSAVRAGHAACVVLADERSGNSNAVVVEAHEAVRDGKLKAFIWQDSGLPKPDRLLDEINSFRIRHGGLLVIEGAERLSAGKRGASIIAPLADWAEATRHTVLLIYRRHVSMPDPAVLLAHESVRLAGFAKLTNADAKLFWDVFHWFNPRGMVAGCSTPLVRLADGWLAVTDVPVARVVAEATQSAPAKDEHSVFTYGLPEQRTLPAGWQRLDTLEMLMARAADWVAATIIIGLSRSLALETAAQLIYQLRHLCGARIKIVVREYGSNMRHSQESVLYGLGANLIVPTELCHSRLHGLLHTLQGQVFSRKLPADYESAVAAAMPSSEHGYLAATRFVHAAMEILQRSQPIGIHNVLVRLDLLRGITPIEALRYCILKRPGDICTNVGNALYVLLFACREEDVTATLARVFTLPVDQLSMAEVRYLASDDIAKVLRLLGTLGASAPDLGADLSVVHARDEQAMKSSGEVSPVDRPVASGFLPISAVKAQRCPLRLLEPHSQRSAVGGG